MSTPEAFLNLMNQPWTNPRFTRFKKRPEDLSDTVSCHCISARVLCACRRIPVILWAK